MVEHADVVKADAPARPVDGGRGRPGQGGAGFFVERIVFREADHGGIFARRAERGFFHQRLLVRGRKISEIPDLDRPLGGMDFGDGRIFGHGQHFQFGNVAGGGGIRTFGGNPTHIGKISNHELHALGQANGTATIEIGGILGHIFDAERSAEIGVLSLALDEQRNTACSCAFDVGGLGRSGRFRHGLLGRNFGDVRGGRR